MSTEEMAGNLLSYSVQVLVLVAAGALLPVLFRVRRPRAQLFYCQALLAACLVLPLLQPWHHGPAVSVTPAAVPAVAPSSYPAAPAPTPMRFDLAQLMLMALAAGMTVKLSWLLLGLWRLRRLVLLLKTSWARQVRLPM